MSDNKREEVLFRPPKIGMGNIFLLLRCGDLKGGPARVGQQTMLLPWAANLSGTSNSGYKVRLSVGRRTENPRPASSVLSYCFSRLQKRCYMCVILKNHREYNCEF